jgi:hypothetical protein
VGVIRSVAGLTPLVSLQEVTVPHKAEGVSSEAEYTPRINVFLAEMSALLAEVSKGQVKLISTTVLHNCKEEGSCSFTDAAGSKS